MSLSITSLSTYFNHIETTVGLEGRNLVYGVTNSPADTASKISRHTNDRATEALTYIGSTKLIMSSVLDIVIKQNINNNIRPHLFCTLKMVALIYFIVSEINILIKFR